MARGKHGRAAALRRQAEEEQALKRERERLAAEEAARARLDAELAEMEALAVEIGQWRQRLGALGEEEAVALRAEVAELVREVAALEEAERRLFRKEERAAVRYGIGTEHLEDLVEAVSGVRPLVTEGVDPTAARKLTMEQVKQIQRARGLRFASERRNAPKGARLTEDAEAYDR